MPKEDKKVLFTGGVNLIVDPLRLQDNEAVRLKNLFPDFAQKPNKRKGAAPYSFIDANQEKNDDGVVPIGAVVNMLFPTFLNNGYVRVVSDGVSTWVTASCDPAVGTARNFKSMAWTDLRPPMVEFGGMVYVGLGRVDQGDGRQTFFGAVDSSQGSIFRLRKAALTEYMEFVDTQMIGGIVVPNPYPICFTDNAGKFYTPRVMTRYRNRMAYAGFDAPYQSHIVFSDDFKPEVIEVGAAPNIINFQNTTREIKVSGVHGGAITAMKQLAQSSATDILESTLVITTNDRCVIMTGEPTNTTSVGDYIADMDFKEVQYLCGCASAETMVTTPMGLVWAGWNDVWIFDRGRLPRPIGTKIRPILLQSPPAYRWQWHAVYHHQTGTYRLALHSPGQAPDWATDTRHLLGEQWWLDLRSYMPMSDAAASGYTQSGDVAWWGPQVYNLATFGAPAPSGTQFMALKNQPVDMAPKVMFGHSPSGIYDVLAEADVQDGYDVARVLPAGEGGIYGEVGNEIAFEVISKKYDFDDVTKNKLLLGINAGMWTSDAAALIMEFIADGGKQLVSRTFISEQLGTVVGGVDPIAGYPTSKEYQGFAFEPSDSQRVPFSTFQFRLYDQPGWCVPYDGLGYQFLVQNAVGGLGVVVTLTPGVYTEAQYWAMVTTALQTALSTTIAISRAGANFNQVQIISLVNWKPVYYAAGISGLDPTLGAGVTAEQERSSRKFFAQLGFDTSVNPAYNLIFLAPNVVKKNMSAGVELVDLLLRVYHFNRKTSGGRYEPKIP